MARNRIIIRLHKLSEEYTDKVKITVQLRVKASFLSPRFCYVLALNVFNLHAITRMIVKKNLFQ